MATQLVIGASVQSRVSEAFRGSVTASLLRYVERIDVHVIASQGGRVPVVTPLPRIRRSVALPRRQRIAAWMLCILGLPAVTLLFTQLRSHISLGSQLIISLGLVVVIAALGGLFAGLVASIVAPPSCEDCQSPW